MEKKSSGKSLTVCNATLGYHGVHVASLQQSLTSPGTKYRIYTELQCPISDSFPFHNRQSILYIQLLSLSLSRSILMLGEGRMGKTGYIAMRTDEATTVSISSDLQDLRNAAIKLANHAIKLGSLGFGTSFLEWVASIAAIYLLVLDRTNWKTNILTSLLIPYIFFSLPSLVFNVFRGQIGRWIAFVAVVLRLFFPRRFPDWLEMPASLILLIVVAPSLLASTFRSDWVGLVVCLAIACYLLQEHIRVCGGFRNSFTRANGVSNVVGIILLFVYPAWALILDII